uniref:hypothetical protein n=1 Tax=Pedobacter schmidteae TaxID=2201271 RepID=UPI000EB0C4B9|nr:hypothetical protein [Pedobacter schmidteae]
MKKLLFVLFLSFACSSIYAQVKETNGGQPTYANGDSYGYYINAIPGAISYDWSIQGPANGYIIYPAGDRWMDVIFSKVGYYDIICVVTMSDYSEVTYAISIPVSEE